jgi:hypothetical protein
MDSFAGLLVLMQTPQRPGGVSQYLCFSAPGFGVVFDLCQAEQRVLVDSKSTLRITRSEFVAKLTAK